mgnify:CR=1 FL=1
MNEKRIIRFLQKHHVLTIATTVNNEPWCANCFYVYMEKENSLIFTTDPHTRHGKEFLINRLVAGSVVLETKIIGKIRGIQFQGVVSEPAGELAEDCEELFVPEFLLTTLKGLGACDKPRTLKSYRKADDARYLDCRNSGSRLLRLAETAAAGEQTLVITSCSYQSIELAHYIQLVDSTLRGKVAYCHYHTLTEMKS